MDSDDDDQMHLAHLSFTEGLWNATIAGDTIASDPVLVRIPRKVLDHVDATWGPYDEVYYHVEFLIAPGQTPLSIDRPMTLVTSIFDPLADAPYETLVLTDTGATSTELHQVTYDSQGAEAAHVRLSLNDIVDLVPALSVAGGRLSMRISTDALSEDNSLTPDSLASLFEAWPPPRWKRAGVGG